MTCSLPHELVIKTKGEYWAIPHDCELLKLLIAKQNIVARDLKFNNTQECQQFIRSLFLMGLQDEQQSNQPSPIADLGRQLLGSHSNITNNRDN